MSGRELRYIVSTARNWAGPIGRFKLTIDKGARNHVVSTCFSGLKPASATTFEAEKMDYVASDDLAVLILSRTPNE